MTNQPRPCTHEDLYYKVRIFNFYNVDDNGNPADIIRSTELVITDIYAYGCGNCWRHWPSGRYDEESRRKAWQAALGQLTATPNQDQAA